jgi:hypothetical protein
VVHNGWSLRAQVSAQASCRNAVRISSRTVKRRLANSQASDRSTFQRRTAHGSGPYPPSSREEHNGKRKVVVGSETEVLQPPRGKDIDQQMIVDLRRMLTQAGSASGD